MTIIKRYANRKLYDTRAKRYITLKDLAELVRRGEDVKVVDHASGDDLTELTLAQIILAQEKQEQGSLPQAALKSMIQASNQALAHLREALPWREGLRSQVDAEIARRIALLVDWGDLTEEDGARLAAQLSAVGEAQEQPRPLDDAALERGLRERGLPTKAEVQALTDRLEALAAELERLSGR